MTVVVLGWDGLDHELVERYQVADGFGSPRSIETITNPELGKPHTFELWPSIITGCTPEEHGIHATDYTEGASWSSWWLNLASILSFPLPNTIRWAVGRRIRDAGATFDFTDAAYYEERGLPTVFDGRRAFPLAIPNYRSALDDALGMTQDRGAQLQAFLETRTGDDGETVHEATVAPHHFQQRAAADAGEKLGAVRTAVRQDYDLVFVWLSYLDTLGHVAPTVDGSDEWLAQAYAQAAAWTEDVRRATDGPVISLSDHGLQRGAHTDRACIATPDVSTSGVEHVLGVHDWLDELAPRTATPPETRARSDTGAVKKRLAELGYL